MNLNLFGSDDDVQTSRFVMNLKKETYDPMLITFNSISAGPAKTPELVKDNQIKDTGTTQSTQSTQSINLLTTKMIISSASAPVDLDAIQKKTQDTSCDYVVFVPTSFVVPIDKVRLFKESQTL